MFDMHCHMLSGTDDGAKNDAEMFRMLDMAYADGIRGICLTPHFQYDYYGDNRSAGEQAFARLQAYASERYPDMELYLGNELFYHAEAVRYLMNGECRTLNGSRYVLMDFDSGAPYRKIENAVRGLVSYGYRPVLAHVERYSALGRNISRIEDFVSEGCVIQVNASSFTGEWGYMAKWRAKKLLSCRAIHVIATDAHHADFRRPALASCAARVADRFGEEYARMLFEENPRKIMQNERVSW